MYFKAKVILILLSTILLTRGQVKDLAFVELSDTVCHLADEMLEVCNRTLSGIKKNILPDATFRADTDYIEGVLERSRSLTLLMKVTKAERFYEKYKALKNMTISYTPMIQMYKYNEKELIHICDKINEKTNLVKNMWYVPESSTVNTNK
uniref:Uncharacterized protein n=1 Tax=Clastoptera arizonana TaxID=38151 RepID=A0A1B6C1M4_9HEMI